MSKVLIINSSIKGEGSVSRALVESYKADLVKADPKTTFIENDLGVTPLPVLSASNINGFFGNVGESVEASQLAETVEARVSELEAADLIVIGAPMYNFGMSALLKTWFDYVLRSGRTFRYTEAGPEGLVKGKKAVVIETRDGFYSEGDAKAFDHQEGHIRTLLGFIGITDVTFVRSEKMAFGPDAKAAAIEGATKALSELAAAA
ncbi:NAD(P)H-dependent oxidoreductase [Asticcacaulis sp. BYS171W]|uniref:FMN dependent NADH:quinone oxidoreductase n=1 Tax=Asticcacaulis aquaticus TaxID=2984212 RepID=A0ABT5HX42_9CAUL|nr:NAD(P)H-dependent oxidoreductase [Asticcacaulis aquaticus]MDC7684642.1 NAD(P)H-dependent oxidoreductase [Asticcacaulis aquaticus]